MSSYRRARVYIRGSLAGLISETDEGYTFVYEPAWLASAVAVPVSLTLPLRTEPYVSKTIFPFFDGLIPEGWLLAVAVNRWKLDRKDRFGLLLVTCRDCIGNVTVEPEETL